MPANPLGITSVRWLEFCGEQNRHAGRTGACGGDGDGGGGGVGTESRDKKSNGERN